MSNNLSLDQVAENQANKEVTINTATGQLDAAVTEALSQSVSSGNITISDTNYRRNLRFLITGATTVGRSVTLPAIKKLSLIVADSGNTQTVSIIRGSTTLTLAVGGILLVYTDGTTNGLIVAAQAGTTKPYDIATYCSGAPANGEVLLRINIVRNIRLPANLTGSRVTAATAATATADFDVQLNGSSIGTIRFAAAGTVATFLSFSATTIVPNDQLRLVAPGTADATLANIAFTFAGEQI